MMWINAFFDIVIGCCALWLMASPKQSKTVRVIMALIACGIIANVAGLVWFGDMEIWPGDLVGNGGIALLLARYIYHREEPEDRVLVKGLS